MAARRACTLTSQNARSLVPQGRSAIPKHAIITALNNVPTPNLEAFARVLRALPHGARVPLEYFTFQVKSGARWECSGRA